METLLARRFRNLSTASLPSDFIFSTPTTKPSTSSTPLSPSKLRPMTAFLPLLPPIHDRSPASPTSSTTTTSDSDDDGDRPASPDSDDDDGAAFSDVSDPTTPSDDLPLDPFTTTTSSSSSSPISSSTLSALQHRAFSLLDPSDVPHVLLTSRLLTLRDTNPALCAGEAMSLISSPSAPVCWRARAGVYRAESLHALGLEEEAKRELSYAERTLREAAEKRGGRFEETGHALMEALVAWNVHVGKLNWGMYDQQVQSPPTSAPTTGLGITTPPPAGSDESTIPFPTS